VTAHGVLAAIEAAVAHVLGRAGLGGVRVAVQGLGNVGGPLCALLHGRGAKLVVSDIDAPRMAAAVSDFGAVAVAADAIYDQAVDIFAPCALGGVLNDATIPRLKTRIVCGGANNQLASPRHADAIAARGIVYIPDYLAGAGGVIDFHQEAIDDTPVAVLNAVARIGAITSDLLEVAAARGASVVDIANERVLQALNAVRT
jgi:leucine dehydrogenase